LPEGGAAGEDQTTLGIKWSCTPDDYNVFRRPPPVTFVSAEKIWEPVTTLWMQCCCRSISTSVLRGEEEDTTLGIKWSCTALITSTCFEGPHQ